VGDDPEIARRVDALRAWLPGDGSLPRELTIFDLSPEVGRCQSCGDAQPYGQTGKCTLCCLASEKLMRDVTGRTPGDGSGAGPTCGARSPD
jgi:hypothetical protein